MRPDDFRNNRPKTKVPDIKEVIRKEYHTRDGAIFETKEGAEKHIAYLNLLAFIESKDINYSIEIANFINKHREALKAIL